MIVIDMDDINQMLFQSDENESARVPSSMVVEVGTIIKAKIDCYCSKILGYSLLTTISFRFNNKILDQLQTDIQQNQSFGHCYGNSSKSWSIYTFQRHLKTHSKLYKLITDKEVEENQASSKNHLAENYHTKNAMEECIDSLGKSIQIIKNNVNECVY